jgi:Regulator of chromosome condensation (RCC1) repeat
MPTDGGVGATGNAAEPRGQSVPPIGKKFKRVAVGFLDSCGILESGDIECWGAGTTPGDCNTFATCGQAVPQTGPFIDLALGLSNSCGMLESGKIKCWGSNSGGRSTPPTDFQ